MAEIDFPNPQPGQYLMPDKDRGHIVK